MDYANEIIDMVITKMKELEQQNDILKAFIKTYHPEIAQIDDITLDVVLKATDEKLQQENKQLKKDIKLDNAFWKQECDSLQEQLAIREKALELACETIKEIMPNKPMYICGSAIAERLGIPQTSEIKDYDYFIEQAKESIK